MKHQFFTKKSWLFALVSILVLTSIFTGIFSPALELRVFGTENGNIEPPVEIPPEEPVDTATPTPVPPTPTPTATPTPADPTPTPTEIPAAPENDEIADAFKAGTYEECTAYFLVAYDDGNIITAKDADQRITSSEISERLFLLYLLSRLEAREGWSTRELISADAKVTVTKAMLDNTAKLPYATLAGLQEGDVIAFGELCKIYMMTFADDAREALVAYVTGSEAAAVNAMNQMARSQRMSGTHVVATDGAYNAGQYTTVTDIYKLYMALKEYSTFNTYFEAASASVTITRGGQQVTATYNNSMYGDVLLYGKVSVPEGYTFRARISGGCQLGLGAQLMYVTGPNGYNYITVIANIPFEKDVAIESARLLELKNGYVDADQELPLGDDTVRYEYLLDAVVEYYTIDNRPYAYATKEMTDRYMMNLTVPVWHLNDATGVRTASTATIPIHRKLYASLKAIMEEVYALPIQFPIKVFLGYGYRRSGGVGLSNCTLMSVHSYGAAVDINPGDYDNDYFLGKGNDLRDKSNPYCIPDEVIAIFEAHGWNWGGNFNICADTMHFQYLGLDYLSYQGNDPFVTLATGGDMDIGIVVKNLQERLAELGFNVSQNGIYNNKTRTALMKFQAEYGLPVTGEVNYKTWETLINATHYMSFVF